MYWQLQDKSEGAAHGLLVELMAALAKVAECDFQAYAMPLTRVQKMVEQGLMDGMVNIVNPDRLVYALASAEPLIRGKVSIFVRKDSAALERLKTVKTLDDLAATGVSVNAMLGSGWIKTNLEARGMEVFYGQGTTGAVKMLIGKRGDVVVDMSANINWLLKDMPGGQDVVELPQTLETVGWHVLISKRSPYAKEMPLIDKALASLKASSQYKVIVKKYLG